MSTRKSSIFYGTLIALSSLVVGIVLASRLDLTPASFARDVNVPATNSAPLSGPIDATTFRNIARDASPSVVSIIVTGKVDLPDTSDFFGFQMPGQSPVPQAPRNGRTPQPRPRQQLREGAGSGFIIDKAGFILTNNHVIENADEIRVRFSNSSAFDTGLLAKVVGRDSMTDSALLQLTEMPKEPLVESKFGDSSQIAPGDWVMAIGNPLQFSNTVTVGVVSAVGRVDPRMNPERGRDLPYIQTDAAINRGNSGGPLLNVRGEVVGINTAIAADPSGLASGNIGIGFAVPINTIRDLLPQLRTGKVVRGKIGVFIGAPITASDAKALNLPFEGGALVTRLEDSGPAKAAGIQPGDVIIEFNSKPTKSSAELIATVSATQPGTTVPVKVVRSGKTVSLNVKVGEFATASERVSAEEARPEPAAAEPKDTDFGMMVVPVSPRVARALPSGKGGALVTEVDPAGGAARSGISPNDVILKINGRDVSTIDEVTTALKNVPSGQAVPVLIWSPNETGSGGVESFVLLRKR
jgi:serine protease Do